MTQHAVQALLADFFQVSGCADPQAQPGVGRCRCHGLDVALYYDDHLDPSSIHGSVDLGTVAPSRQREVFRSLLLRNPSFQPEHSAVLGLDAESDRVVLVARIAFEDELSGQRLAAILTHWVQKVFVLHRPKPALRFSAWKPRTLRWPS